ncbi:MULTISPECIES: TetR/AcrR family transcriptional regulator [unclassified Romboutsia]|uniref:TetR/AcrR family transcriptional regulator n=1 Tax=unclassified Romboutsia TaxID=2626894 RepID=UPI00082316DB|nr:MULTISPECIES: TetR/AcrR family transcriptional regulator [unclassified Romboutsia]SCH14401.1 Potential acrAB operon repressor [uncultured Clostridium sp.]
MKSNINMKENILNIAINLITKNGIKNTSLSDIAKTAGISKGTLYYHYASKDDLIFDIADNHLKIITDAVLDCVYSIENKSSKDDLINIVMGKISTIGSTGRIHMYLLCEAITGNEPLRERIKLKYIQWRTTLQEDINKYLHENIDDSEAFSFLLISIIDGLVVQSILKTEEIPFEKVASFLVNKWI